MRFRSQQVLLLILPLLLLSYGVRAQETGDTTLHILHPSIHAEQDKAELCLEFDRALEAGEEGRARATVKLEAGGRVLSFSPQSLSVAGNVLCVSSLDHRKEYRITVSNVRGAKKERMAEPYSFSFTVPDRQPALSIVSTTPQEGMMRWGDKDPSLRALNVASARIELYQITQTADMIEAWRQRQQTGLAPTESVYFAKQRGKLLWRGDLTLEPTPNKNIEQKIPLSAGIGILPPGLYLLAASAPETKIKQDDNALAPLAASWLLRSDLSVRALRDRNGFHALTEKADGSQVVKDVRLLITDRDQKTLAEGKSDGDGIGFLALSDDRKGDAVTLAGFTEAGDPDFADLTLSESGYFILPAYEASLALEKEVVSPGASVNVTLSAHDAKGQPVSVGNSVLQLLRPDKSFYTTVAVPRESQGALQFSFPAPVINGLWTLVWQQSDGKKLAEKTLRVTSHEAAPSLEISSDRPMLGPDGALHLSLRSTTKDGSPAAYVAGRIAVNWITPQHIFPGWDDYRFGTGENKGSGAVPLAAFLTDENGAAELNLTLKVPGHITSLPTAVISADSDPTMGITNPEPILLPLKPQDYIVGIKPSVPDAKFNENSMARFYVIALDAEGKKHEVNNLSYQIYEEGRSFEWYQSEGRWNYKPLQQQRHIGGGSLNLKTSGNSFLEWPAAAGNYRLEIMDSDGNVRARFPFSAGWFQGKNEAAKPVVLDVTADSQSLKAGQDVALRFKLLQDAMVSVFIADDKLRKIFHMPKSAGENEVRFTPDENWSGRVGIWIEARSHNGAERSLGQVVLPVARDLEVTAPPVKEIKSNPEKPSEMLAAFDFPALTLPTLRAGDSVPVAIDLQKNGAGSGSYKVVFSTSDGLLLEGNLRGSFMFNQGQRKTLDFILAAKSVGEQTITVEITGAKNFKITHSWPVTILALNQVLNETDRQEITGKQNWDVGADTKNEAEPLIFVGPEPLYHLPEILSEAVLAYPFTTNEIAERLEMLRLWRDVIVRANLMPETKLLLQQRTLSIRLLQRQKADGSFPPLPGSESDIASTSSAILALGRSDFAFARPAVDQASGWLKHKLENSWFEERERMERPAAYVALVSVHNLDTSNLHYFADTSADKILPSDGAAQIALAFASINDRGKAEFWLGKARPKGDTVLEAARLLPLLAENEFYDVRDLLPKFSAVSDYLAKTGYRDRVALSAYIRAAYFLYHRAGIWRVAINNGEQSLKDILLVTEPQKPETLSIRNPADKSLYAVTARSVKKSVSANSNVTRRIYHFDGREIVDGEEIERDQSYLVVLEGSWPQEKSADALWVYDSTEPVLRPSSCALEGSLEVSEALVWVKGLSLVSPQHCEKTAFSLHAMIKRQGGESNWKIAYVTKPSWRGAFSLLGPAAYTVEGGRIVGQGSESRIRIR